MALTADHGFADTPEWAQARAARPGGWRRACAGQRQCGAPAALACPSWHAISRPPACCWTTRPLHRVVCRAPTLSARAKEELLKLPGVLAVFDEQTDALWRRGQNAVPGGDAQELGSRAGARPAVRDAARMVPQLVLAAAPMARRMRTTPMCPCCSGARHQCGGGAPERVEIADLAPTLAGLLALPAPAQAQGASFDRPRRTGSGRSGRAFVRCRAADMRAIQALPGPGVAPADAVACGSGVIADRAPGACTAGQPGVAVRVLRPQRQDRKVSHDLTARPGGSKSLQGRGLVSGRLDAEQSLALRQQHAQGSPRDSSSALAMSVGQKAGSCQSPAAVHCRSSRSRMPWSNSPSW